MFAIMPLPHYNYAIAATLIMLQVVRNYAWITHSQVSDFGLSMKKKSGMKVISILEGLPTHTAAWGPSWGKFCFVCTYSLVLAHLAKIDLSKSSSERHMPRTLTLRKRPSLSLRLWGPVPAKLHISSNSAALSIVPWNFRWWSSLYPLPLGWNSSFHGTGGHLRGQTVDCQRHLRIWGPAVRGLQVQAASKLSKGHPSCGHIFQAKKWIMFCRLA